MKRTWPSTGQQRCKFTMQVGGGRQAGALCSKLQRCTPPWSHLLHVLADLVMLSAVRGCHPLSRPASTGTALVVGRLLKHCGNLRIPMCDGLQRAGTGTGRQVQASASHASECRQMVHPAAAVRTKRLATQLQGLPPRRGRVGCWHHCRHRRRPTVNPPPRSPVGRSDTRAAACAPTRHLAVPAAW